MFCVALGGLCVDYGDWFLGFLNGSRRFCDGGLGGCSRVFWVAQGGFGAGGGYRVNLEGSVVVLVVVLVVVREGLGGSRGFCAGSTPAMNKPQHCKLYMSSPVLSIHLLLLRRLLLSQFIQSAQQHRVEADWSRAGVNRQWRVELQEEKLEIVLHLLQVHSGSSADSDSVTSGSK